MNISELLDPYITRRSLGLLTRTYWLSAPRLETEGDRVFEVVAPTL